MQEKSQPMWEDHNPPAKKTTIAPDEKRPAVVNPPPAARAIALKADEETGLVELNTLNSQLEFAQYLIDNKMISSSFETKYQVVLGIQHTKELGLPIMEGLKMMYVVNGKPSLYGDGPLALVQRSPYFEGIKEFFIDEKGNEICFANKNIFADVHGAVIQLKRKGDPFIQEDYFTKKDLALAKLDVSKYGKKDVWAKFERNMFRFKARAMAIKTKFADVIHGINISEFHEHFDPTNPEIVVDQNDSAKKLADEISKYGEEETVVEPGGSK